MSRYKLLKFLTGAVVASTTIGAIYPIARYSVLLAESSGNTDKVHTQHLDNPDLAHEHLALLDLVPHNKATHVAVKNGSWFNASTWKNGVIPGNQANVLIQEGVKVTYDDIESEARLRTVRVDGILDFAHNKDTKMVIDTLVVDPKGELIIGTETQPIQGDKTAQIIISDNGAIDLKWDPEQLSRGLVSHGRAIMHGQEKTSHLPLKQDALAGDKELILNKKPTNWKVGDDIVLTGTHYVPRKRGVWQGTQDEELKIVAINNNRITLDRPLAYDHDTPQKDLKAYVANYSRNIVVETENHQKLPANQRGHVMFMHSDDVDIRYAEFLELGRTDKSKYLDDFKLENDRRIFDKNGDPIEGKRNNIRGRYALHFHQSGVDNINEQPAVAKGNAVWGSPGFGYVHHDSNVLMENNAAYNVFGSAFVSETGNEIGSWENNIAIKSEGARSSPKETRAGTNHDIARNGSGFWFQGRLVGNKNNVAAGMNGHGFLYLHRGADNINVLSKNFDNPEIGRYEKAHQINIPAIQSFQNNEVFASGNGLEVIKANPRQNHDLRTVFDGFKGWELKRGAKLQYTAHYTLNDFKLVGSKFKPDVGLKYDVSTEDIVLNRAQIEGFKKGIELKKTSTAGDLDNYNFIFVDTKFANNEENWLNYNPKTEQVLTRADLVPGTLTFEISPDTKLSFSGYQNEREVEILGKKTDEIGEVEYMVGNDAAVFGFKSILNRGKKGYYTLKDGTKIITLEEFIANRTNDQFKKVAIPLVLDSSLNSPSRFEGTFANAPNLGAYNPAANPDGADMDFVVKQTINQKNQKVIGTSSIDIFQIQSGGLNKAIIHAFEDNKDKLMIADKDYKITGETVNGVASSLISFAGDTNNAVLLEGVSPDRIKDNILGYGKP